MTEEFPLPEIDQTNEPFWNGLSEGKLLYQKCNNCNHSWLPAREECPNCQNPITYGKKLPAMVHDELGCISHSIYTSL